jgi:hypothetical protein
MDVGVVGQAPAKLADEVIEVACARHAWETNRAFCSALGADTVPWEFAQHEWRDKMRSTVKFVLDGGTAESKHGKWCENMRADGWSYGPEKNEQYKHHPMLQEWEKLSHTQRIKEELVVASINAMALALGHSKRPMKVWEETVNFTR